MGEGVAKSSFRLQKCYMMRHMGRRLAENVRIPKYGERDLKLLKKPLYDI